MNKTLFLLTTLSGVGALHAQTFTAANGFTSSQLFNLGTGFTISALGASSTGDLYYLASGDFGTGLTTELFRRTAASGYSTASQTSIYDFGSKLGGTFVKVSGSTVYFGEGDFGSIHSISTSGAPASHKTIGTVENNYDLAVSGSDIFVSANPGFTGNKVFRLVLSVAGTLQQLDTILDTGTDNAGVGDNSGPIVFDASGRLIYGATGDIPAFGYDAPLAENQEGGVFSFANLSGAIDADPAATDRSLSLSQGSKLFTRGSNQVLAARDLDLFQTDGTNSFSGGGSQLFDLRTGQSAILAGTAGASEFFGGLAATDAGIFLSVSSDFSNGPSAVFLVVPEPGSVLLVAAGAAWMLGLRARRSKLSA